MPLSTSFINTINTVLLSDAAGIDDYFTRAGGQDFISWFNSHAGGKQFWHHAGSGAPLTITVTPAATEYFNQLWSSEAITTIFGTTPVSLLQFIALQSIIINETGGQLIPLTEKVGMAGHPGLAYAFDAVPGIKQSYNTLRGNRTCLTLFNDRSYNDAFGHLPLAAGLMNTTDTVWAGQVYPQHTVSTSTLPEETGYVLEADFFKFRGRGFIQTTGRTNYTPLIQYVTDYAGGNPVLAGIKTKWEALSGNADTLASLSTNRDWDSLFQQSDCLVAGKAIALHNAASGNYLQPLRQANGDTIAWTLYHMGLRISGGDSYATLFQNRVLQVLELLQE